jgi:hypothetical protein
MPANGNDLLTKEMLAAGQPVRSPNGRFTFTYQVDRNLVPYENDTALWAPVTKGTWWASASCRGPQPGRLRPVWIRSVVVRHVTRRRQPAAGAGRRHSRDLPSGQDPRMGDEPRPAVDGRPVAPVSDRRGRSAQLAWVASAGTGEGEV